MNFGKVWRILQISNKEFNLQNTLVNGQCFNWRKLSNDHYEGIFNKFYIEIKRENDNEVQYFTIPSDEDENFIQIF
jgi:hypothetical protein